MEAISTAHRSGCACPACFSNIPAPVASAEQLDPAERTARAAEKILWWVRLFGIVWLTSLTIGLVVLMFALGAATK